MSGLRVSHEVTEQVGEILASMSDPGRNELVGRRFEHVEQLTKME